jgi:hypothetical protein
LCFPTAANVNQPKAVVAGNVYHVVNTNDIPVNRMTRGKRRGVHWKGKHKLSEVKCRDSILRTYFRSLSIDKLYLFMTASSSEAFVIDITTFDSDSKHSYKHTQACNVN